MKRFARALLLCAFALTAILSAPIAASAQSDATLLHANEAAKLLPDAVFYAGKSANTQLRNSAGLRFSGDHYTLAVLVDTSGYSSTVQEKYQGYLLTEVPLEFSGHRLPPGAYGFGFTGGQFLVMDIGNHDLLHAACTHDAQMQRPMPLQILEGGQSSYRLCSGRNCVAFQPGQ